MKLSVVACELPHPQGTAAGRDLWGWCEGVRALGHELDVWVWFRSSSSPEGPVPSWCRYEPFDAGPMWKRHLRAIVRPRGEIELAGWEPAPGAIPVADHYSSFAAVLPFPRSVATIHFRSLLDAWAVRDTDPARLQTARIERKAGRRAGLVLAYSERVARHLRSPATVVPIACIVPEQPVAPVDEPVVLMMADWSWPPNRRALSWLLACWPDVRQAVPAARLVLAGRHIDQAAIGTMAGVEPVGEVADSLQVLSRCAVVAFPCPPSSGPKYKVLEALAYGIPVVTTAAGAEGVLVPPEEGPVTADRHGFADALVTVLLDPEHRAALGRAGRQAVERAHSPLASARARIDAITRAFDV